MSKKVEAVLYHNFLQASFIDIMLLNCCLKHHVSKQQNGLMSNQHLNITYHNPRQILNTHQNFIFSNMLQFKSDFNCLLIYVDRLLYKLINICETFNLKETVT